MAHWPTTLALAFLALMAGAASILALVNARQNQRPLDAWQRGLTLACGLGCLGLFIYRWALLDRGEAPTVANVDGLMLVAILLAAAIGLAHLRRGLAHLDLFALPVLTLILAWAFCASRWSFRVFDLLNAGGKRPGWLIAHLAVVYVGTVCLAVAAVGGAMYLVLERRVRRRTALPAAPGWGSLERIEALMRRSAAGGFALIGLSVLTGVAIALSGPTDLGPGWWYSPKVILAIVVWLMTGVLVGVRFAGRFRGRRAAWLSIAALVLMLVVLALANALQARAARNRSILTSRDLSGGEGAVADRSLTCAARREALPPQLENSRSLRDGAKVWACG